MAKLRLGFGLWLLTIIFIKNEGFAFLVHVPGFTIVNIRAKKWGASRLLPVIVLLNEGVKMGLS